MSLVRRNRFKAFDDRTGRLERALALVNDGHNPGLKVMPVERDRYNPQSRKLRVPPDRVALNGDAYAREVTRGRLQIDVGWYAPPGSNYERPGIPSLCFGDTYGTYSFQFDVINGGYGEGGFGVYGFGGVVDYGSSETRFW